MRTVFVALALATLPVSAVSADTTGSPYVKTSPVSAHDAVRLVFRNADIPVPA